MKGGGCQVGASGIRSVFGLEAKAPELGSLEDNGKKRGEEEEVYGCVCIFAFTGGQHKLDGSVGGGGACCLSKRACSLNCVDEAGKGVRAPSVFVYGGVYSQMLAQTVGSF